jgi:hypothetical protein
MPSLDAVEAAMLSEAEAIATAYPFGEIPSPTPRDTVIWNWVRFERYSNYITASIVAGRLEVEGVPTIVEEAGVFPGIDCATIWVPKALMHRARWVLAWPTPTDSELTFLATGELLPEGGQE